VLVLSCWGHKAQLTCSPAHFNHACWRTCRHGCCLLMYVPVCCAAMSVCGLECHKSILAGKRVSCAGVPAQAVARMWGCCKGIAPAADLLHPLAVVRLLLGPLLCMTPACCSCSSCTRHCLHGQAWLMLTWCRVQDASRVITRAWQTVFPDGCCWVGLFGT
jgi:hypothetical protein